MRVSTIRLAAAALTALAALTLTACSDDRDLLAPGASATDDPNGVLKPIPRPIPIPTPILNQVVDITSGVDHVCSLTFAGVVSCWGSNTYGQIGTPSTDTCGEYGYGLQGCVPRPTIITGSSGGQAFAAANIVSAGTYHTCVLSSGTPWCWGSNESGQLGNGTTSPSGSGVVTPTPVGSGGYTSVGAGGSASCGINGTLLYCWGKVGMGTASSTTPLLISWMSGWTGPLNVGAEDACAFGGRGTWFCWGSNWNGQLGLNPAKYQFLEGPFDNNLWAGATNVVSTSQYTCFDAPDGTVKCLGFNEHGELGDPSFTGFFTYAPRTVGGSAGLQLSRVAVGATHACALDPQGSAWCWGLDGFGALGRGTTSGSWQRKPAPVVGGLTFSKLVAGNDHTCGLTGDARVFCWGSNYSGQLASPNHSHLASNPAPVQIVF